MDLLFVPIMAVGREHVNIDFGFEDFVNQPMLLGNGSAPLTSTVTLQLFGMTCTRTRMQHQFVEQFHSLYRLRAHYDATLPNLPRLSANIQYRTSSKRIKPSVHFLRV